jgi:hypothetical protein
VNYKDLVEYSVLKRQEALSKKWIVKWVNVKEAEVRIEKIKEKAWDKFPLLKEASKAITSEYTKAMKYAQSKWLLDEDLLNKLQEEEPDYVSYFREVEKSWWSWVKAEGSILKRIKWSEKKIIDPFRTFDNTITRIYERADLNEAYKKIDDLSEPLISAWWMEKVKATPIIAAKSKEFAWQFVPRGQNIVEIWKDWKPVYYKVHPEIAKALKGMSPNEMSIFLKPLAFMADLLRATATRYSPTFILWTNLVRDMFTAQIVWQTRFWVNIWPRNIFWARRIIKKYQKWIRDSETKVYEQALEEWAFIPPKTNEFRASPFEIERTNADVVFDAKKGSTGYVFKNPLKWLKFLVLKYDDLWLRTEQGTRFATWLEMKKKWASLEDRVMASREITVDFLSWGTMIKDLNSVIAFLNASFQWVRNVYRTFKDVGKSPGHAIRFSVAMSKAILAPTIAVTLWNSRHPEEYEWVPAHIKQNFFVIVVPNTSEYIAIPMPWSFNWIGYAISEGMFHLRDVNFKWTKGEMVEQVKEWLKDYDTEWVWTNFINWFNPTPVGCSILSTFMPSWLKPLFNIRDNETWYCTQIKPNYFPWQEPDPKLQYYIWKKEPAKILKDIANVLDIVANKTWADSLKMSPADLQYWVNSYTSAVWKLVSQTADVFQKPFKEFWDLTRYPIISTVFRKSPTYKPLSPLEKKFLEKVDIVRRAQNNEKILLKMRAEAVVWDLERMTKESW